MKRPRRTIQRCTEGRWRGRQLVVIVPPAPDTIGIRHKGCRTVFEIDLASVYDMAAKKAAQLHIEERKARRGRGVRR